MQLLLSKTTDYTMFVKTAHSQPCHVIDAVSNYSQVIWARIFITASSIFWLTVTSRRGTFYDHVPSPSAAHIESDVTQSLCGVIMTIDDCLCRVDSRLNVG